MKILSVLIVSFFFAINMAQGMKKPFDSSFLQLLSGLEGSGFEQDLLKMLKKSQSTPADEKCTFYEDYLTKYYPKALVIRSNFLANMSPTMLDAALDEIVKILKKETALYFVDHCDVNRIQVGFYWEAIVDQISLMSEFLKKAYVDLITEKTFLLEPLLFGAGSSHLNCNFLRKHKEKGLAKPLLGYFKENRLSAYVRFYATYFDFLNKLFNEGILFQDVKQAQRYMHELEFVMTKLRGTEFERQYEDALKVCKELVTILQTNLAAMAAHDAETDELEGWGS